MSKLNIKLSKLNINLSKLNIKISKLNIKVSPGSVSPNECDSRARNGFFDRPTPTGPRLGRGWGHLLSAMALGCGKREIA